MDASEFLRESDRMCRSYENCDGCPGFENACYQRSEDRHKNSEGVVATVQQWAKDHPIKTRQSEFLKMFPNAKTRNGIIALCPQDTCKNYEPDDECDYTECALCRKRYWLTEVTDND